MFTFIGSSIGKNVPKVWNMEKKAKYFYKKNSVFYKSILFLRLILFIVWSQSLNNIMYKTHFKT